MKNKLHLTLLFFGLGILSINGCGNENSTAVKTSAEMEEFMDAMDGKYESVTAAIQKFAVEPNLNTADMDMKDLRDPVIIKATVADSATCYIIKTNDGASDCEYELCWSNGKIISITDNSVE